MMFKQPPFVEELTKIEDEKEAAEIERSELLQTISSKGFQVILSMLQDIEAQALSNLQSGTPRADFEMGKLSVKPGLEREIFRRIREAEELIAQYSDLHEEIPAYASGFGAEDAR